MNYFSIAKALYKMGYRGPVGLESNAAGDVEVALQAFRSAFEI
jgi:hydroxypyruvate isomerase